MTLLGDRVLKLAAIVWPKVAAFEIRGDDLSASLYSRTAAGIELELVRVTHPQGLKAMEAALQALAECTP